MRKVAPLITSSESNLAEEPVAVYTTKRCYKNGRSRGKTSLLSALGSVLIKTTLMKSLYQKRCGAPRLVLSKQELTTVAGRRRDAQTIKVPGA